MKVLVWLVILASSVQAMKFQCTHFKKEDFASIQRMASKTQSLKSQSWSADCDTGTKGKFHSFVTIRLPHSTLANTPHCADTKYAQCKAGLATCTTLELMQEKLIFHDLGCGILEKHVIQEAKNIDCIIKAATKAAADTIAREIPEDILQLQGTYMNIIKDIVIHYYLPRYKYHDRALSADAIRSVMFQKSKTRNSMSTFKLMYNLHTFSSSPGTESFKSLWDKEVQKSKGIVNYTNVLKAAVTEYFRKHFPPGPVKQCVTASDKAFFATACSPAMAQSFGYPFHEEREVKGMTRCGGYKTKGVIASHPAFVRFAIDYILSKFPEYHNYVTGTVEWAKFKLSTLKSRSQLPSECTKFNTKGLCWLFSQCTQRLAEIKMNEFIGGKITMQNNQEESTDEGLQVDSVIEFSSEDSDVVVNRDDVSSVGSEIEASSEEEPLKV